MSGPSPAAARAAPPPGPDGAAAPPPPAPGPSPSRRRAWTVLRLALLVVALAFLVAWLVRSWPAVRAQEWRLVPGWLLLAVAAMAVFYISQALVWWLLLRGCGLRPAFLPTAASWAASVLARYVPGGVVMFLSRAVLSRDQGLPLAPVAAAMVYEQAVGFAAALVTVAALAPLWGGRGVLAAAALAGLAVLLALLHPHLFRPLADRLLRLARRPPLAVVVPFPAVLGLVVLDIAAWLVAGAGVWALARGLVGLGSDALPAVVAGWALAYVAGMLAVPVPSGLGVREGVLAAALAGRLAGGVAVAWALAARLLVTVVEVGFAAVTLVLARRPRRLAWRSPAAAVLAGMVAFAVVYSLLAWLKYRAYMDARFDLGNMVQAVYNTAHGRFLEITTGEAVPRQMSRLGSHVDPVLALFALPWLLWPSPVMLLVAQAAVVATGAWPVYRFAARVTGDAAAGALLAGAYLLYPATGFLVLNEFHPVALATPLLLWALLDLEERRWWRAAVFLALAAACKETVPLTIAVLGGWAALRQRSWRPLPYSAAAALWFVLAVWVVIPHYSGGESVFIGRFSDYGDSAGGVLRGVLGHPLRALGDLVAPANLRYWFHLLWPLAFTPLGSPLTFLVAAPELLLNALSSVGFQRRIEFHYTALAIPFLVAAAVLGVARLARWRRAAPRALAGFVLAASVLGVYLLGPLPLELPGAAYRGRDYARSAHAAVLDQALRLVPADVPVSVNNNVGAQLSARPVVFVFPCYEAAEWVVVDQKRPFVFDREDPRLHGLAVDRLALDRRFRCVFARDGVLVFRRVGP